MTPADLPDFPTMAIESRSTRHIETIACRSKCVFLMLEVFIQSSCKNKKAAKPYETVPSSDLAVLQKLCSAEDDAHDVPNNEL